MSERYINNLTGDFSICFSEHLTEHPKYLIHDEILISELDKIKEMAVKCMEQYISQQKISEADKEKMKQNHKQWLRRLFRALSNDFVSVENILKKYA